MRKERGITLITLVITIIILIILAGVSINLVLGENGILSKAKEAKTQTESGAIGKYGWHGSFTCFANSSYRILTRDR